MSISAIFLDRDGTLVADYPDDDWAKVTSLDIFSDTVPALQNIPSRYTLFIVTNQYLIGENIISYDTFSKLHKDFIAQLKQANVKIEQTYFCPHARDIDCQCHKPSIGMIEQCLLNYDVDLSKSYFIGDSESDITLANTIGCQSIAVRDYQADVVPTHYADNVELAISYIINGESSDA